ncbi:unnamed protein product [Bursaphelenchus okinawaensis]|uniref:glycogenin glucosyltransferase n=1 Tax=Bursaphelenchus okinawaensis TaxID=465554 RepID=A0A811LPY6_9BILA|nr:unnamed protein product [Bursaphelenchus okinawaensis]CAG9126747.1 unnamed protein product [Bursaphelenchus okinawaensis]
MNYIKWLLWSCFSTCIYGKVAYVSTLTSDSFLLAAEVLGFSIKQDHHNVEYLVVYTEDISQKSVDTLTQHGIKTLLVKKLDTPYKNNHTATKYQYTKVHLWSLTEYDTLVHLDLDTLVVDNVEEVFQCGEFCAALRHSDMFNSGVFVLKPNLKVYNDMLNTVQTASSYDGGDQGFLNTYFWQLKYAQMFGSNHSECVQKIRRLSSIYNYDIGMYYLSNRMLVTPKIIHYTLGPIKPWDWYGYPLFDMNWKWHEIRLKMHHEFSQMTWEIYNDLTKLMVATFITIVVHLVLLRNRNAVRRITVCKPSETEQVLVTVAIMVCCPIIAFYSTPKLILPQLGWLHYTTYLILSTQLLCLLYSNYLRTTHYNMMAFFVVSIYMFVFKFVYCNPEES